ncbi:MAG: AbrB/MazE/SpoVT family DNA-binding domain-containing protein [Thermomicrobiales bacterium]
MTAYTRRITRKGQVTIPIEIRRSLGIADGDRVDFVQENGAVRIIPTDSVTARTYGILHRYARVPPPTAEEEREAFEWAVAQEVWESMNR